MYIIERKETGSSKMKHFEIKLYWIQDEKQVHKSLKQKITRGSIYLEKTHFCEKRRNVCNLAC